MRSPGKTSYRISKCPSARLCFCIILTLLFPFCLSTRMPSQLFTEILVDAYFRFRLAGYADLIHCEVQCGPHGVDHEALMVAVHGSIIIKYFNLLFWHIVKTYYNTVMFFQNTLYPQKTARSLITRASCGVCFANSESNVFPRFVLFVLNTAQCYNGLCYNGTRLYFIDRFSGVHAMNKTSTWAG